VQDTFGHENMVFPSCATHRLSKLNENGLGILPFTHSCSGYRTMPRVSVPFQLTPGSLSRSYSSAFLPMLSLLTVFHHVG